jgi:L-threonylcarbamoyladenylate synthase
VTAPGTIAPDDPAAVDRATAVLRRGGTVLLPTDTVYGIAALPSVEGATGRLFALKGRSADHPLAVLVSDVAQARALVQWPHETRTDALIGLWPGPLTVVFHRSPAARSLDLGGEGSDTIGVRCPDHDLVRAIARTVGPIATTSANRSGDPTPADVMAAAAALIGPVGLIVDGGEAGTVASTVVDVTVAPWRILRQGSLRIDGLA